MEEPEGMPPLTLEMLEERIEELEELKPELFAARILLINLLANLDRSNALKAQNVIDAMLSSPSLDDVFWKASAVKRLVGECQEALHMSLSLPPEKLQ